LRPGKWFVVKKVRVNKFIILFLVALVMSACLPVEEQSPTAAPSTATATLTPLPSATIIWFPPTPTFTPAPSHEVEPTRDLHSGLDRVILEDSFTDTTAWATSRSETGSVAFGKQELTLAVALPRASLISFRQKPQLSDFYLEIDVLPSLCRSGDNYGLLMRASSTIDFYRLLLNCDGQVRLERMRNGKLAVLQDWMTSGQILPGGMMRSRLGVWLQKDELRVNINQVSLFTAHDPAWTTGQLGVFARSAGDTPLTVSFSKLVVYGLGSYQPPLKSKTIIPSPTPKR
jgi:hypothetical protein